MLVWNTSWEQKIKNGPKNKRNILCRKSQKIKVKIIIYLEANSTDVCHLRCPRTEHFEPLSYPGSLQPSSDTTSFFHE